MSHGRAAGRCCAPRRVLGLWPEGNFGQTIAEGSHRLWEAGVQLGAHGQMLGLDAHRERTLGRSR